jgi:phenylpropionate dioxygenase-like ring-hydroxylating dioxygenase large terminal subunit
MGRKPVILCRDQDNEIHVFLNTCRHRGAMLCREKAGTKKVFQCMYHAWAYRLDGRLSSVPGIEGYGGGFRKEDYGLYPAPRVESYRGIIFASLDPAVPPLAEHLGGARNFLDSALGTEAETEVIGVHEYEYGGNWKLHLENTIDGYHPRYLHRFVAHAGMWSEGEAHDIGNGHGALVWKSGTGGNEAAKLSGFDGGDATPALSRAIVIFPNMILVQIQDFINLRQVIPVAHDRTKVYATALGARGEAPDTRMRRAIQLSAAQGPAGVAGADDIELFEAAQEGFQADDGDLAWLDISRGHFRNSRIGDLEDETAVRGCYREWRRLMAANGKSAR